MQIFLDTADVSEISSAYETGLIDGVTTNPTLIKKSGRNPRGVYQEIKMIGIPDISMEVVCETAEEMRDEGVELHNVYGDVTTIKVPCTVEGLKACKYLSDLNIRINVTLIFNSAQATLAAKAGATYVSPFVGRLDDNSISGLDAVKYITELYRKQNVATKVLSASIRDVDSVTSSFYNGAHIVTMPPSIFWKMYNHVLTDRGMDMFQKDWDLALQSFQHLTN